MYVDELNVDYAIYKLYRLECSFQLNTWQATVSRFLFIQFLFFPEHGVGILKKMPYNLNF